jgi:protein-disulfide isomerase
MSATNGSSGHGNDKLVDPVSSRDHVRGPDSAKVTLVEYGDFECPFCVRAEPVLRELGKRFGNDLRIVFRHNPRVFDHPHARKAAEAAEAAADQGKFWEMHDALYRHESALDDESLEKYATDLGLDLAKLRDALASGAHHQRVHDDELSGVRNHIISTPTFFVNGDRFHDKPDIETMGAAIEAARASKRS